MMDEERFQYTDCIRSARRLFTEILNEPHAWTRRELSELANAAGEFIDAFCITREKREDRILASWLESGAP